MTAQGEPGWVGARVRFVRLSDEGEPEVWARAWLTADGSVACDRPDLLAEWQREGVLGRASAGLLHPQAGQAFLDELPYMYKSAYCFAEPDPAGDSRDAP